ncbi:hypothetical protein SAMN05428988_1320 [Chitinophaga sp. YR573]|uniref:hypothetical protein n=1 Tax=Chitinophaga sp. YR573 TaxID=1881040 RepID=UPI0008C3603C|nr:hypothetical protein [Chitinophaga sp. YR573]SEW02004.1 hypothetical protein SAMN05428988_1320 [Chitinophaga sp. YR573]
MKSVPKIFYSLLLLVAISAGVSMSFQCDFITVLIVAGCLSFAVSFLPMPTGVLQGVILEQWAAYIIERFWKDNQFLKRAYDDSQYVMLGRIVHIPQPGAKPAVQKNRNVFPAVSVRRTDGDVNYSLDEYSTDPTHIPNIDAIHLSYSKQDSVMGDHMSVLNETVADDMLLKWGANAPVVKTTGGLTAATVAPVTGQVGNRLGFHHKDLAKLMIRMNMDNVPKDNRQCLVDDNMYEFFYDTLSENSQRDFSKYVDAANGVVGRIHGFDILTRSAVLASDNADAIKALGSALGATDNLGSLAWQKNSAAFAIGDTKVYQNADDALYYGGVTSTLVMAGGRVRRTDGLGIYNLVQGTPAP